MLLAGEGQLEERSGRLGKAGCAAGEKVDLTAAAAHSGPNPGYPHAHRLPFKLLRDSTGAEPATAFGAWFLLEFTHRFFPRLVGDTHQGSCVTYAVTISCNSALSGISGTLAAQGHRQPVDRGSRRLQEPRHRLPRMCPGMWGGCYLSPEIVKLSWNLRHSLQAGRIWALAGDGCSGKG